MILYLMLLVVPFGITFYVSRHTRWRFKVLPIIVLSSFIMSVSVAAIWLGNDLFLDSKVAALDRNGDGFWSTEEQNTWTEQEQGYLNQQIGDGGRNVFSLIIFPFFAIVYSTLIVLIWYAVTYLYQRQR